MKPGSVIVDLAAENGGNCVLTKFSLFLFLLKYMIYIDIAYLHNLDKEK